MKVDTNHALKDNGAVTDEHPTLGIIAGNGILPILVARGARSAGYRVCCEYPDDRFDGPHRDRRAVAAAIPAADRLDAPTRYNWRNIYDLYDRRD